MTPDVGHHAMGEALSPKNFTRLADLIHSYSGIKMPPSKTTMLEGRLRRRTRAFDTDSPNAYCEMLFSGRNMDDEIIHLIDAITTNKTDFFREPQHFDYMKAKLLPVLEQTGRREIKVWSAACSIGAEPYTLAMVMEEYCRVARRQTYSILCTDLCTKVLEQAILGIFPEEMMDPVDLELRRRYVLRDKATESGKVRMVAGLRSKLSFARLNLMDDHYPVDCEMDIIFCRNILIYFDKPTQVKVIQRLCSHLRPGGHLFLGHSETVAGIDVPLVQVANTIFQRR